MRRGRLHVVRPDDGRATLVAGAPSLQPAQSRPPTRHRLQVAQCRARCL